VAILGANGFIGARTAELLEKQGGYEVVPVSRREAALQLPGELEKRRKLADAFDQAALTAAFDDCDAVVSAIAGDPRTIVHTIGPLYAAAAAAGVRRIVYLSSAVVHGHAPAPGSDESSELSLDQPLEYNKAKILAERRLRELREDGTVQLTILRPGIVYGPRSQWTRRLAEQLRAGAGAVPDGGAGVCNAIFIDNLVHAIDRAISVKGADGEAFLLNDRETVTWRDMIAPIAELVRIDLDRLPRPESASILKKRHLHAHSASHRAVQSLAKWLPPRIRKLPARFRKIFHGPPPDLPSDFNYEMALLHSCRVRLPTTKAERVLGFSPPVSFAEGCRRSVEWLRAEGYAGRA
jgi:nucleoside-diphosphate-sugar epimerase